MELKEQIYTMNSHWENVRYDYPFARMQLPSISAALEKGMITTLIGPRRVGKTVLMKQTIQRLIDSGNDKRRILFFSFDDYRDEPFNVLKQWGRRALP
jgi:predicted AAA+ superfamily ATPase